MASSTSSPVKQLVESTADAMDNIFDIYFKWPWEDTETTAEVSYRAEGVKIPQPSTETYDKNWHGVKVYGTKSGVKLDRKFDITFRLDATYTIYKKFKRWNAITHDVNASGVANTSLHDGRVRVVAAKGSYIASEFFDDKGMNSGAMVGSTGSLFVGERAIEWVFDQVDVLDVQEPDFKNKATGEPIKYKVSFTFGDARYPTYPGYSDVKSGVAAK